MFIEEGVFSIDTREECRLHGNYDIKKIRNRADLPADYKDKNTIHCQSVYAVGNVLFRSDTEDIEGLIHLFIRYTHEPCEDVDLKIINENVKIEVGKIPLYPTKKTLFSYKSKVFVAYGRYIFGYDTKFAKFQRLNCQDSSESSDDSVSSEASSSSSDSRASTLSSLSDVIPIEDDNDHLISQNRIILKNVAYEPNINKSIYSFCIFDQKSGVLDAFGLYR